MLLHKDHKNEHTMFTFRGDVKDGDVIHWPDGTTNIICTAPRRPLRNIRG